MCALDTLYGDPVTEGTLDGGRSSQVVVVGMIRTASLFVGPMPRTLQQALQSLKSSLQVSSVTAPGSKTEVACKADCKSADNHPGEKQETRSLTKEKEP